MSQTDRGELIEECYYCGLPLANTTHSYDACRLRCAERDLAAAVAERDALERIAADSVAGIYGPSQFNVGNQIIRWAKDACGHRIWGVLGDKTVYPTLLDALRAALKEPPHA